MVDLTDLTAQRLLQWYEEALIDYGAGSYAIDPAREYKRERCLSLRAELLRRLEGREGEQKTPQDTLEAQEGRSGAARGTSPEERG